MEGPNESFWIPEPPFPLFPHDPSMWHIGQMVQINPYIVVLSSEINNATYLNRINS